jgi:shikimate kinase / 3-dehydroquinate synthase
MVAGMSEQAIFLYGPSGSGKTTVGNILARSLNLPFHDLDIEIENHFGKSIPQIFSSEGEASFRRKECEVLQILLKEPLVGIVALGGGTLLNQENRTLVEVMGPVLVFTASSAQLATRLRTDPHQRPLLADNLEERLVELLKKRDEHYRSFPFHMDTEYLTPHEVARQVQIRLGMFHLEHMGIYDVRIQPGSLDRVGAILLRRGIKGPLALVSDDNTGKLYSTQVKRSLEQAGYVSCEVLIPPGEDYKTIQTVQDLWGEFMRNGLERSSTILSLGGGVVSDLTGFAAATYLRGVQWVVLPTTLLSMADASLGGKTGIDLPQGKNLAGAFHAPSLVLADPEVLKTLPVEELRSGLGEIVKHGVLSDPILFQLCKGLSNPSDWAFAWPDLTEIVRRAVAVKVDVIEADPYEKGLRAILNYGHTIGHAIEKVSEFSVRHGEAVAIGMVLETHISEGLGIATPGLTAEIESVLSHLGLPVRIPAGINQEAILNAIGFDKKRSGGQVLFALPVRIGESKYGIQVDENRRKDALIFGTARS